MFQISDVPNVSILTFRMEDVENGACKALESKGTDMSRGDRQQQSASHTAPQALRLEFFLLYTIQTTPNKFL